MSAYKVIDLKNWKRAIHCEVFRKKYAAPVWSQLRTGYNQFPENNQRKGLFLHSFSFVYIVSKCANECEEFRYRFQDGEVVLFERIDTSFTYMDEGKSCLKWLMYP